jgi:hypothetical protein
MGLFVHLTTEDQAVKIKKNGIKTGKIHYDTVNKGVFCMPVISDFYSTHQWLREIKRFNFKNIIGIYFKIPDEEIVFGGHYNKEPIQKNATEATKEFMELEDKLGYQVIIPRKIKSNEIKSVKMLPQLIGWRYFPKSHEKKLCFCPACLIKGEYRSNKLKEHQYYQLISDVNKLNSIDEKVEKLSEIGDLLSYVKIKDYKILLQFLNSDSHRIIISTIEALSYFKNDEVMNIFINYLHNHHRDEIRAAACESIFRVKMGKGFEYLEEFKDDEMIKNIIVEYEDIYSKYNTND